MVCILDGNFVKGVSEMDLSYTMRIAGVERALPLCRVTDELYIGAFVIFGDVELTCACAKGLLEVAPEHDLIITAESKGIPLAYEMARQEGVNDYVIARKREKVYMSDVLEVTVQSITTKGEQKLYLGKDDVDKLRGKKVLIVDDVISTGESLRALEALVEAAGGEIVGKAAILAEGDAAQRKDIVFIEELPLFDGEGNILK